MKKKCIFIALAMFAILLIASINVNAETESFSNLTMDISISEEGTASVSEVWEISVYSGTELYKTYYDMETSEIENLSVTDENGEEFEFLSSWDVDASMEEKAEKCGINYVTDGYEICFGIGEYGYHIFTISYDITNFVSEYEDEYQLTYFTLVPQNMEPAPKNVIITISAEFEFTEDNVTATGSGFTGTTIIEDGSVIFETSSAMTSSQYITVNMQYDLDTFDTSDIISSSDYYLEDEETENTEDDEDSSSWTSYVPYVLIAIIVIIIIVFIVINRRNNKPEVI